MSQTNNTEKPKDKIKKTKVDKAALEKSLKDHRKAQNNNQTVTKQ